MLQGIILSNRHKALLESMQNFGDSIAGIRKAQQDKARQDKADQMAGESHAASMKSAQNQDALQGFALRQAGQQEQDASALRSDQNELSTLDSGLPSFGPRMPADETPSPFVDQNRNLRARLLASIETKQTGKPISRDEVLARKESQQAAAQFDQQKDAADLESTKAGTVAKLMDAKKAEAEIRKTEAEMARLAKGGMDPDKAYQIESGLQSKFLSQTQNFTKVRDAYSKIQVAQPTAAGDMSLVYGYMTILDPGSSVKEGEFATASNAGGVSDKVRNMYNAAIDGTSLQPAQRKQFKDQAGHIFGSQQKIYESTKASFENLATKYQVDPSRVTMDLAGGVSQQGDSAGPASASSGTPTISTKEQWAALPAGTSYIGPDGKRATKK